jgi:hypothetical protein
MSDEHTVAWRDNILPEKTMASARERRTRRHLGGSRVSNLSPGVRQQQSGRESLAVEKRDVAVEKELSITHNFCPDHGPQFDVGQPG